MIYNCPFCGSFLEQHLTDGLAGCLHCSRTFDSCPLNVLLATAWYARKTRAMSIERLISETKVDPSVAAFVVDLVVEDGCSHDEFFKAAKAWLKGTRAAS